MSEELKRRRSDLVFDVAGRLQTENAQLLATIAERDAKIERLERHLELTKSEWTKGREQRDAIVTNLQDSVREKTQERDSYAALARVKSALVDEAIKQRDDTRAENAELRAALDAARSEPDANRQFILDLHAYFDLEPSDEISECGFMVRMEVERLRTALTDAASAREISLNTVIRQNEMLAESNKERNEARRIVRILWDQDYLGKLRELMEAIDAEKTKVQS